MRISHKYKFIFLANPRTGSTTIRNTLDLLSDIKSVHITEISEEFPFYHHISAMELKHIFNQKGWDWWDYKKFCVVRNPFDRIVSLYHHNIQMETDKIQNKFKKHLIYSLKSKFIKKRMFKKYVKNINPKNRLTTSLRYFLHDGKNRFLIDDVLKFENIKIELPGYLKNLGIKLKSENIPHLNKSGDRKDYIEYYDKEAKNIVENIYLYEIKKYGYSFGV